MIAAKTTKNTAREDPSTFQPMEETDQTLNVDRFMTLAYKRTITTDATMPEMWLLPISSDATEFCKKMREKYDRAASNNNSNSKSNNNNVLSSNSNDGSSTKAGEQNQQVKSFLTSGNNNNNNNNDDDSSSSSPSKQIVYSPQSPKPGGIYHKHKLENEGLPESVAKINEHFDKVYSEFVDRKMWLFRYDVKSDDEQKQQQQQQPDNHDEIHEDKRYMHWSDILKNSTTATKSSFSAFREAKSLKNFQGDKCALSEALGVAWEAAAEAEEQALLNWNRIQSEKKKKLEAQIAHDEKEIQNAEKREEELRKNLEKITLKKAEAEVKEDRIKSLQDEIKVMELRLETARQVKNQIEDERRIQREKESEMRERLVNEERQHPHHHSSHHHSSLLGKHMKNLSPATALEAAMSVLSPEIAVQVQNALSSHSQNHHHNNTATDQTIITASSSSSSPASLSDSQLRKRHQQQAMDHYLNYTSNSKNHQVDSQNSSSRGNDNDLLNPKIDGFKGYRYEHKNLLNDQDDPHSSMVHSSSSESASSSSFLYPTRRHVDVSAALRQIHEQYGYSCDEGQQQRHSGETGLSGETDEQGQFIHQRPRTTNPLLGEQRQFASSSNTNVTMTNTTMNDRYQSSSTPHELKNWVDPGSVASAFAVNSALYGNNTNNNSHSDPSSNGNDSFAFSGHVDQRDMRVPLRLLAADLDAYLTRSVNNSNQILTTLGANNQNNNHDHSHENDHYRNHQQAQQHQNPLNSGSNNSTMRNNGTNNGNFDRDHYLVSSAAALLQQGSNRYTNSNHHVTSDPLYYGEDLETRKRILNRVHELKSVLNGK